MKGGRWWEDVLEVLGARFLEAMKWGVGVVLGQALVVQAITRQRHRLVLGQCHPDDLPIHLLAIQVAHCFGHSKGKGQWLGCCSLSSSIHLGLGNNAIFTETLCCYESDHLCMHPLSWSL